jgi:hypothetical protein
MSDLHFMAPEENEPRNGSPSVVDLRIWKELRILSAPCELQEIPASQPRDSGCAATVDQGQKQVTSIDQQLEMLNSLASRHYPDNEAERNACLVRLLTERLRQYAAMFHPLNVREMRDE